MEKTKVVLTGFGRLDGLQNEFALDDLVVVAVVGPSITTDFKMSLMVYDKDKTLIGEKNVTLIEKPEQIPWLDAGSERLLCFSRRITDPENAAAYFNANHCLDDLIKNSKDTGGTKSNWILNIADPISTGNAKTVGYGFPNVQDSGPEQVIVDISLTEDDVGTSASATGRRSGNSGAKVELRENISEIRDRNSNELGYWDRVLDGVTRAADLATRAADVANTTARLAAAAARLATLAGLTGTCMRLLIAEIVQIFN